MKRALTFALTVLLLGLAAPHRAEAQDDTRVLRARHMEEAESEQYAALAEKSRLESIEMLKGLLAEGSATGDRKAEMMLRLADLYYQQGRAVFLREMKAFDTEYETCFNTEGCDTAALHPNNTESMEWQAKAIKLYEHILENYPRYNRADEATYYLGAALNDVGRPTDAVEYFIQLVKMYPDSAFVPDSYVLIGEFYFEEDNNAYKALLAYKKATAYPDHPMYGFATYKLAWCYYNVGEYGKSIETMKAVYKYSQAQEAAGSAQSRLALGEEALKDLVRFFADAGDLEEAYQYFVEEIDRKDLLQTTLKRLASTYMENGKWEEAIQTYRRLIAEDPQNPKNPEYQHEIVTAYQKMGNSEATFTEVDRMLKTYGANSAWARANASDQEVIRGAQEKIEKDLLTVATYHHDRGRKLAGAAQAADFDLASRAYAVYLDEYPQGSSSYDVHYQYAELLYKLKHFDTAYTHYVAVVTMDPNGKHSKFCAESAIFAAEEMIKQEQAASPPAPSNATDPIPLTPWEEKLVESCDRYVSLYQDEKVRNILYKSAYVLYHKHQLEPAAERFRKVIALDPGSREAEQAAHLILDSFVMKEDWGNLAQNAKFFYEQEGLGSKTFKKEVYEIYQNASLKLVEVDFEKTHDYSKAADAYMAFYESFPDSPEAARILNNAALYYGEAHRVGDSMKVRHLLVEDPKFGANTKYYYLQIGALGFDHETVADFDQAAFYYEKLFALYPKEREKKKKEGASADDLTKMDQQAADAIYSAAVFQRALGDWQQSITDYKAFVATFPTDKRVDRVSVLIGTIYAEEGDLVQAGTAYYNFYSRADADTAPELVYYSRLHYARALEAQVQITKAKKVVDETIWIYKKYIEGGGQPGPQTDYVAEMMFDLAQPTYTAYEAKKITGCDCRSQAREDAALGDTLKAKIKGLAEVESTYAAIIKTGSGEYGLAALVQLGKAYDEMAQALRDSDVPYYLTADQREIYQMRLEDKIYPQTQKAIEAYKAAMEKSWELTLYDDSTAYATRRLGELAPADYPGLKEDVPLPNLAASEGHSYSYETNY